MRPEVYIIKATGTLKEGFYNHPLLYEKNPNNQLEHQPLKRTDIDNSYEEFGITFFHKTYPINILHTDIEKHPTLQKYITKRLYGEYYITHWQTIKTLEQQFHKQGFKTHKTYIERRNDTYIIHEFVADTELIEKIAASQEPEYIKIPYYQPDTLGDIRRNHPTHYLNQNAKFKQNKWLNSLAGLKRIYNPDWYNKPPKIEPIALHDM